MRWIGIITLLIMGGKPVGAQQSYMQTLLKIKAEKTEVYQLRKTVPQPIIIRMGFNKDSITNPQVLARLKNIAAERIDLVYTAFRESKTFDQPELNRRRLDTLLKYAPNLVNNTLTEWHFIAQLAATTVDSAEKLFHGIIIYPKVTDEAADTKKELTFISGILDSVSGYLKTHDSVCLQTTMRLKSHYSPTGYYLSRKGIKGGPPERSLQPTRKYRYKEMALVRDTIYRVDSVKCLKGGIDYSILQYLPDSAVIKALERNPQWKNKLVVTDVTGSMSPYTTQLLVWFKLRESSAGVKRFEFFNDGDDKPTHKKQVGNTGGIYFIDGSKGFGEMHKAMQNTMLKGDGGDIPENNIEALVKGLDNCPDCKDIVMIADNWAPVKDIQLLHQVRRPVHIILCGVENGAINTDYLDIARKTGGSIHTLEDDLTNLMNLNEGQTIQLGKRVFKIINGRFQVVSVL